MINSVSGLFSHGQIITIKGSGFGSKVPAKPLLFWNGENGSINPSPLGIKTKWDVIANLALTSSAPAPYAKAATGTWPTPVGGDGSLSFRCDFEFYNKIYHYMKRRYDTPMTRGQKFWRLYPHSANNDFVCAYVQGSTYALSEIDTDNPDKFNSGGLPPINAWMREEFIWQHSGGSGRYRDGSVALGDGIFDYIRDGKVITHQEGVKNGPNVHAEIRTDNFSDSADPVPAGAKVWMTDIYIDTVLSRIIIGNAPTLAACTVRELAVPVAWSDGQVDAVVNHKTLKAGETAYLYVIDASGKTSAAGFPIVAGTVSAPTPTPAPTPAPVPETVPAPAPAPTAPSLTATIIIPAQTLVIDLTKPINLSFTIKQ